MRILDSAESFLFLANNSTTTTRTNLENNSPEMGGKKQTRKQQQQQQKSTPAKETNDENSRKNSESTTTIGENGGIAEEGTTTDSPNPAGKCRHLKSSINHGAVQKKLKKCRNFHCEECSKLVKRDETDGEIEILCCLACGHLGCGRYSTNGHAIKHSDQSRTGGPHSIVLSLQKHTLWCYTCDDEIALNASAQSKDTVDLIQRHFKSIIAATSSTNGIEKNQTTSNDESTPKKPPAAKTTRAMATRNASMPAEIKGLANLGNTCFFNAVMQNIAQTHILHSLLIDMPVYRKGAMVTISPDVSSIIGRSNVEDHEMYRNLPPLQVHFDRDPELMTMSFQEFLADFRRQGQSSVLNPGHLFGQICKKAPRFRGFQQQDSHELLRHMLDALRHEELKRLRAAVIRHFGLDPDDMSTNKATTDSIDVKTRKKMNAYGNANQMTFVEQVFGGQLLQVITCLQCRKTSERHEHFLDLSLPVVDPKDAKKLQTKNETDGDGELKVLERKNGNEKKDFTPSKHQEKKTKAQTRKNAKKSTKQQQRKDSADGAAQNDDQTKEEETDKLAEDLETTLVIDESPMESAQIAAETNGQSPMEATLTPTDIDDGSTTIVDEEDTSVEMARNESPSKLANGDDVEMMDGIEEDDRANKENEQNGPTATTEDGRKNEAAAIDSGYESYETSTDRTTSVIEPLRIDDEAAGSSSTCNVLHCLRLFTAVELLNGKNKFGCANCAKINANATDGSTTIEENKRARKDSFGLIYTDAEKRYLIESPPAVLTLHLKRFHQVGTRMQKIAKHVDFPLILDIAPYCCKNGKRYKSDQKRILYSLYGIVCHSGGLSGGHYVAYVKVRAKNDAMAMRFLQFPFDGANQQESIDDQQPSLPSGKWYYISDSHVSEVQEERVLAAEAYLLFYERLV